MREYQYISFWRVIACIGVFIVHLGQWMKLEGSLRVVTDFGSNGVVIFFILTGFLALNSKDIYDNKMLYWKKRAVKILPLYIAVLLFYFSYKMVLTQNFRSTFEYEMGDNVGGTWTLHTFILFYLLVPFIINIVNSYLRACILWILTFAMRLVLITLNLGSDVSPLRHLCFCVMGMVLFYAMKEKKEYSMIFCALSIAIFWMIQKSGDGFLIYSLLFVVMIFSSQQISIKQGIIKKIVEIIDQYSYEIYLAQGVVGCLFMDGRQMNRVMAFIYMFIGTTVIAFIAHWIIVKPCERMLGDGRKIQNGH